MGSVLEITRCVIDIIQQAAADSSPHEACGLLFGTNGRIDACMPCRNVAEHPDIAFEIDPAALIAAYRAERGGGPQIAGCFHSHPSGDVHPSLRDAEAAEANGRVWIITAGTSLTAYRAVAGGPINGRFEPLALVVGSDA